MDNLTHTLFGATLARTPLARAGRGTTAALIVASNAPDIDVLSSAAGTTSYMRWHRGPTHGVLGIIGLGLLTAAIVWFATRVIDRRDERIDRGSASFPLLTAVSIVGVTFHILMDLPTSYGTRLLSPFAWHWYAFDWLPIIDVYLLVILIIGLLFGSAGERARARGVAAARIATGESRRRMAAVVLALMAANYGLRAASHHQAIARAPQLFGPLLPKPCDSQQPTVQSELAVWPRTVRERSSTASPDAPGRPCLIEIAAIPTFISPFRWRLVAHLSNAYELHEIDLLDARLHDDAGAADRMWRLTVRYPDQWTRATGAAAASKTGQAFLGFSRFPAARTFSDPTGGSTIRWTDVRFAGGVTSLEGQARRPNPFSIVVRVDPSGRVIDERVGQ